MSIKMLANTIQSIMTTDVVTVAPGATLKTALTRMRNKGISCIIINRNKKPLGVITERDVLRIVATGIKLNTKVAEVMRSPVKTVSGNMDVYDAAVYLNRNNVRRIIIVDGKGHLAGLVTQTDLRNHLGSAYYIKLKTIEDIMNRDVITAQYDQKLLEAVETMYERNLGCIIICRGEQPVGILTERDILNFGQENRMESIQKVTVSQKPLVTISAGTSIYQATRLMKSKGIRRLPVVDKGNALVGLVTESDIVKHLETAYLESMRNIMEKDKIWVNSLKEGIFESTTGIDGVFTWINQAGAIILGYSSPEKIIGKKLREVFVEEEDLVELNNMLANGKVVAPDYCSVIRRPSGDEIYIEGTFYYLRDEDDKIICLEGTLRDVTDRKRIEDNIRKKVEEQTREIKRKNLKLEKLTAKLHSLSIHDGLTGINNFRYFTEMLDMEFKKARRYNLPLSSLLLDIDDFKVINDRFGHAAGDLALMKTAQLLKRLVRETDIVARYGGDEFAIILPNTGLPNALAVVAKILSAFRKLEIKKDSLSLGNISLSIGVASIPDDRIESSRALIETADKAMYHAKQNGKDGACTSRQVDMAPDESTR